MAGERRKNPQERIEPTADWRQRPGPRPPPRPSSAPAWRDRRHWRWALLVLALLALLLTVFRQPLAERLWPDTRIQQLLDAGDAALKAGRLSAADGGGARQRFEAALALDSDRGEARTGLARVAKAALGQADAAAQAGRFDAARQALALARELQAPRAETEAVANALRRSEAEHAGIEQLLRQAQAAQAGHRLDGDAQAALPLYQRILALQPERTDALEGREDALAELLLQARRALAAGDLEQGAALVERARGYDPGHVDLPDAQSQLSHALEQRLRRADVDLRQGRRERALAGYRAVVAAAAGDEQLAGTARRGIGRVADDYAARVRQLAADYRFDEAERTLRQAHASVSQTPSLRQAEQYLQHLRQSRTQPADAHLSAQQRRQRLQALLAGVARAQSRGQWIAPPGDSAYDQLRSAQALAPEDAAVEAAAAQLLAAVENCFESELNGNRPRRARACYDAWAVMQPGDERLGGARRQLAQKWLAVGDEQLGGGDVAFAEQALQQARELDASAPGMAEFARRVRDARAGNGRR